MFNRKPECTKEELTEFLKNNRYNLLSPRGSLEYKRGTELGLAKIMMMITTDTITIEDIQKYINSYLIGEEEILSAYENEDKFINNLFHKIKTQCIEKNASQEFNNSVLDMLGM